MAGKPAEGLSDPGPCPGSSSTPRLYRCWRSAGRSLCPCGLALTYPSSIGAERGTHRRSHIKTPALTLVDLFSNSPLPPVVSYFCRPLRFRKSSGRLGANRRVGSGTRYRSVSPTLALTTDHWASERVSVSTWAASLWILRSTSVSRNNARRASTSQTQGRFHDLRVFTEVCVFVIFSLSIP